MPLPRVVFVHGAATTSAVWSRVGALLPELEWVAIERPCTGDLERELAAIAPLVEDALLVGVGGGATLGLALVASPLRLAGAILHEPAIGSLAPGLLAPMAEAFATGGVAAFAERLYGPSWTADMAPDGEVVVARELPMFRGFEPAAASSGQGPVLTTVGALSSPARHEAARALAEALGYETETLHGCSHFVHWDNPGVLAERIKAFVAALN